MSGLNPSFGGGVNAAVVFDSSNPTGQDPDLGSPNETCAVPGPGVGDGGEVGSPFENCASLGKILIVGEDLVDVAPADGLVDDPDDADLVGATLSFDFSALGSVTVCGITLIDVEANEPSAELVVTFADLSEFSFTLDQTGDNGVATLSLPCGTITDVIAARVVINGSGGIDNLVFQADQVVCNPCIDVIVKCLDAAAGQPIEFNGRVRNCGDVDLTDVDVVHDNATLDPSDDVVVTTIATLVPGEQVGFQGSYFPAVPGVPSTLTVTVDGTPPEACGLQDVTASSQAICTQEPPDDAEGCTPGFWKNHEELWDEAGDPIAAAAGFTTDTLFNSHFGLTAAESGISDSTTMDQALALGGGGGFKLARHGISALLNLAAGLAYDLPAGINDATELTLAITNAYISGNFEPLASQLAAANEAGCPF